MAFAVQYGRVLGGAAVAAATMAARKQDSVQCANLSSLHRGSADYAASTGNGFDTMAYKKDGIVARSALFKTPSASYKDSKLYQAYLTRFGGVKELSYTDVQELLGDVGIHHTYLASRIFHVMDSGNKGTVSFKDVRSTCKKMAAGTPTEKAELVFKAFDLDGSGSIDKKEVRDLLKDLLLANHEANTGFRLISTESEEKLYDGLDTASVALLTANRMVGELFAATDARSGEIDYKAFSGWVKRGGKVQNDLMNLFPLFEVFSE
jgi:Ca2+-binding EF-hand superfamily protein